MELAAPIQFNYQVPEGFLLLFALLTGIVFGMLLEKAGFGNARKLVEQFYFTVDAIHKFQLLVKLIQRDEPRQAIIFIVRSPE